jgi:predicted esterase
VPVALSNLTAPGPHDGAPVRLAGVPLDAARAAAILLHGRGASAAGILPIAHELALGGVAYLAPDASGNTWYPQRFLVPIEMNEPWLSSALAAVDDLVTRLAAAGFGGDRLALLGFSQGACLSLEYAVRHPQRFGAIVALSGGLIGPPGTEWPSPSALAGTPVFLGCGDPDPHIPAARVRESAEVFRRAGAEVTAILYPGLPHTVGDDEIERTRELLMRMAG